jgi:hypothetical protein
MEQPGSITAAIAIAALERAETLNQATVDLQKIVGREAGELVALRQDAQRAVAALGALQPSLQRTAEAGIRQATQEAATDLHRRTSQALAPSLQEIERSAELLRTSTRRQDWWTLALVGMVGILLGFLLGYFSVIREQWKIEDQLTAIQQSIPVAAQPATPDAAKKGGHGKH